jgi:predicted peptidase
MKKPLLSFVLITLVFLSCEKSSLNRSLNHIAYLNTLPADTGGVHEAVIYNSDSLEYGYFIYYPSSYIFSDSKFPLILFLHGAGEKGNSMNNPDILSLVLKNGPPKLIESNNWRPRYPCIVVSPQCHEGWWSAGKLESFIQFLLEKYSIHPNYVYLTGLSMGGFGTFSYLQYYGDINRIAAAVPICGGGNPNSIEGFKNTPLWAFHGDNDNVVPLSKSLEMVNAINASEPLIEAKLTVYPGVGHNSWSRTYDSTGIGDESSDYDAFSMSIYDWFFQFAKTDSVLWYNGLPVSN